MATTKLYLTDIQAAYKTRFNGKIIGIEENKIILDRSLFYPIGGGQNWDVGYLEGDNGKIAVTEVRGRDLIEHHVESDHQFSIGDEIIGSIDWERRFQIDNAYLDRVFMLFLISDMIFYKYLG